MFKNKPFPMKHFPQTFLAASAALALTIGPATAANLSLTQKGVVIESAGFGSSTLEFPQLKVDKTNLKPQEVTIDGKVATLKFEGGGQIAVDVSDNTKIVYRFSELPAETKNFGSQLVIKWGEGTERKWQFDAKSGDFPADKPTKPHLFQGNAKVFTFSTADGRQLTITPPDYTYNELVDAREWGTNATFWKLTSFYNKDWSTATIKIDDKSAPK